MEMRVLRSTSKLVAAAFLGGLLFGCSGPDRIRVVNESGQTVRVSAWDTVQGDQGRSKGVRREDWHLLDEETLPGATLELSTDYKGLSSGKLKVDVGGLPAQVLTFDRASLPGSSCNGSRTVQIHVSPGGSAKVES